MYAAHFGLRDNPFAITPDPGFLFLSPQHQEALAHLLYGTGEDGGFVALTGEVGTGKTTLIRALLEQRLNDVDVALCLNPRLTVLELLGVICDELNVDYPRDSPTLKPLLDALNAHLLDAHARGRRTVLIIDEAQNLDRSVLEQVRLLTNLETRRHKLLRIILAGQPELGRLLAREDLRQLNQRITARYHLPPLSRKETAAYIIHRLRVAGGRDGLFTPAALRAAYRLSRGIPRLINILCDRALLGAYSLGRTRVDAAILRRAARETLPAPAVRRLRFWLPAAALVGTAALALGLQLPRPAPTPAPEAPAVETPAVEAPAVAAPAVAAPAVEAPATTPQEPTDPLAVLWEHSRFDNPMARLLAAWGEHLPPATDAAPCDAVKTVGLACLTGAGDWAELRRYDRPALLRLHGPDGPRQVLLRILTDTTATLETGAGLLELPRDRLAPLWNGEYLLLWRPEVGVTLINPASRGAVVAWLYQRLAMADGTPTPEPPPQTVDERLLTRIQRFQQAHGLTPDGLVGPRTLPLLNNLAPTPGTPLLSPPRTAGLE